MTIYKVVNEGPPGDPILLFIPVYNRNGSPPHYLLENGKLVEVKAKPTQEGGDSPCGLNGGW